MINGMFDTTVLSDLNGKLTLNGPPHFKQGDYTSLLSIRITEDIFGADGNIYIYQNDLTQVSSIRFDRFRYLTMEDFAAKMTADPKFNEYCTIQISDTNKKAFKIEFKTGYEDYIMLCTGNLFRFVGCNQKLYGTRLWRAVEQGDVLNNSILSCNLLQIKCDKLACSLQSYYQDPVTNQFKPQFSSNVLQILTMFSLSYQSKNMDLHIKLQDSMPLDFYITDQDNELVNIQYILQMRFYLASSFREESDSGVTAIHSKKQIFIYLTGDVKSFKFNQPFENVALCQANGVIGKQIPGDTHVLCYNYDLKINRNKFGMLHAYRTSLETINNAIFVWTKIDRDCILNFEYNVNAIEYTLNGDRQLNIKNDQRPNILMRLFVK
ncbi:Hypothetical_protein [Hexamita inflata]|uniref:Hypothetical_protein n=1 Tax=Hexamita inflata TaxID=28002 RepID=A0AA86Q7N5_9EUKA|nr:Hypothetical protein HINF_LOCUS35154 [Hexamita inflata]